MQKKDFKVSYDTIIKIISYLITFVILWIIVGKYVFEYWNSSVIKFWNASSSFELTVLLLIIFGSILFGVCLINGIVNAIVRQYSKYDKWHDNLIAYTIKIPITEWQDESIKENRLFFIKGELKDSKPYFDSIKLNTWAEKIIEKELKRLK